MRPAVLLAVLLLWQCAGVRPQADTDAGCSAPAVAASGCECEPWLRGVHMQCDTARALAAALGELAEGGHAVHRLVVRDTAVAKLSKELVGGALIRQLVMANVDMTEVEPGVFTHLADTLEELDLSDNALNRWPRFADGEQLAALVSLALDGNKLTAPAADYLGMFPALKQLRLEKNSVCSFPDAFFAPVRSTLVLLDASDNCVGTVPRSLAAMDELMYLDVSNNKINELPNANWPHLKELRANGNSIVRWSGNGMAGAPALQYLRLADNRLPSLASVNMAGHETLETADFANNNIAKLSRSAVSNMPALTSIVLDSNAIDTLSPAAFHNLPRLQLAALQRNEIAGVPEGVFDDVPALGYLTLTENMIESVDAASFSGTPALQQLFLHSNKLRSLPPALLSGLSSLNVFDAADNELSKWPAELLSGLGKLQFVDMSMNKLETLEEGTFPPRVQTILLHDNRWQCDESLEWLTKYLLGGNVRTQLDDESADATCHSPAAFAGVRLKELLVKKANKSLYDTLAKLTPNTAAGGADRGGGGLGSGNALANLLPSLSNLINSASPPALAPLGNSPLGGALSQLGKDVPGFNDLAGLLLRTGANDPAASSINSVADGLRSGLETVQKIGQQNDAAQTGAGDTEQQQDKQAADALSRYKDEPIDAAAAISEFTRPLTRFASGYQASSADIEDLLRSLPALAEAAGTTAVDPSELSPDLLRHILNGGQLPNVPAPVLKRYVTDFKRRMAKVAADVNDGVEGVDESIMPPVSAFPKDTMQNVLAGEPLDGLTAAETAGIKQYYMRKLQEEAERREAARSAEEGPERLSTGELMRRLPDDFDIARLPADFLEQIAAGAPLDLRLMPDDLLKDFREHNPDIDHIIESMLSSPPPATESPPAPAIDAVLDGGFEPYEVNALDRQADLRLVDGHQAQADRHNMLVYTLIGSAVAALLTAATLGYFCYRRYWSRADKVSAAAVANASQFLGGGSALVKRTTVQRQQQRLHAVQVDSGPAHSSPRDSIDTGDAFSFFQAALNKSANPSPITHSHVGHFPNAALVPPGYYHGTPAAVPAGAVTPSHRVRPSAGATTTPYLAAQASQPRTPAAVGQHYKTPSEHRYATLRTFTPGRRA